ncbi:MAG TPA: response regulator [Chloroflexota bacterium]|nr:response regulator [Chloroflexota bacterium]
MIRYRILVADPNPAVRKLLSMVFDSERCELSFASDGEEALGMAIVAPPDLVIAELRLDRLDGIALCERLKEHSRTVKTKLLFLTTCASEWEMRRARRAKADGYMTKPFSPMALLRQADELLEGKPVDKGEDLSCRLLDKGS